MVNVAEVKARLSVLQSASRGGAVTEDQHLLEALGVKADDPQEVSRLLSSVLLPKHIARTLGAFVVERYLEGTFGRGLTVDLKRFVRFYLKLRNESKEELSKKTLEKIVSLLTASPEELKGAGLSGIPVCSRPHYDEVVKNPAWYLSFTPTFGGDTGVIIYLSRFTTQSKKLNERLGQTEVNLVEELKNLGGNELDSYVLQGRLVQVILLILFDYVAEAEYFNGHVEFNVRRAYWKILDNLPLDIKNDVFSRTTEQSKWKNVINPFLAWFVPTKDTVQAVVEFVSGDRVLEVGGGRGLFARLLQLEGVEVLCTDNFSTEGSEEKRDHDLMGGLSANVSSTLLGTELFTDYPDRVTFTEIFYLDASSREKNELWAEEFPVLMLVYPTPRSEAAFDALSRFRGNKLIYVQSKNDGSTETGSAKFHTALEEEWTLVKTLKSKTFDRLPIVDFLMFYTRTVQSQDSEQKRVDPVPQPREFSNPLKILLAMKSKSVESSKDESVDLCFPPLHFTDTEYWQKWAAKLDKCTSLDEVKNTWGEMVFPNNYFWYNFTFPWTPFSYPSFCSEVDCVKYEDLWVEFISKHFLLLDWTSFLRDEEKLKDWRKQAEVFTQNSTWAPYVWDVYQETIYRFLEHRVCSVYFDPFDLKEEEDMLSLLGDHSTVAEVVLDKYCAPWSTFLRVSGVEGKWYRGFPTEPCSEDVLLVTDYLPLSLYTTWFRGDTIIFFVKPPSSLDTWPRVERKLGNHTVTALTRPPR